MRVMQLPSDWRAYPIWKFIMKCLFLLAPVFVVLCLPVRAHAERPPQKREAAPVVLTGIVEAVDEQWDLETDYYRVSVRVQQVERGPAIPPGGIFVVSCFRWTRNWFGKVGARGHTSIPHVGDKIRLFAWPRATTYEGNYPDWYDVIGPSSRPWFLRPLDRKKVQVVCVVVGINLVIFVAWFIWRKMSRKKSTATTSKTGAL